jgi:hypothetical protein
MSGRLPWRLLVILGWVVILVVALEYCFCAVMLLFAGAQSISYIGSAWYLTLLGGALITLILSIAIGRRMYSIARAQGGGCALVIVTPLLLLCLLGLLLWSGHLEQLLPVDPRWNLFIALYELLRRFIG